jgi:hypothetical protein
MALLFGLFDDTATIHPYVMVMDDVRRWPPDIRRSRNSLKDGALAPFP